MAHLCCTVRLFVGHDDCARIQLDGQLLHRYWDESGMGRVKRQSRLPARLDPGRTHLLAMVECR